MTARARFARPGFPKSLCRIWRMFAAPRRSRLVKTPRRRNKMNASLRSWILAAVYFVFAAASVNAQGTLADYQRAEKFLPGNLRHQVYVADVTPHWIEKTSRFWYRKAGPTGTQFILVDPAQNSSGPAFDHTKLAESLSRAAKREYTATQLPFDSIEFSKDGQFIN